MALDGFDDLLQNVPGTQDAVNLQLAGIGLTEVALARLLNAEVDMLRRALDSGADLNTLFLFNRKAERILRAVIKKEMILEFLLEDLIDFPFPPAINVAVDVDADPQQVCAAGTGEQGENLSTITGTVTINGVLVPNVPVLLSVTPPLGTINGQPATVVTTGTAGQFTATFAAGATPGLATVTATVLLPGVQASDSVNINIVNCNQEFDCCADIRLNVNEPNQTFQGQRARLTLDGDICDGCVSTGSSFVFQALQQGGGNDPILQVFSETITDVDCEPIENGIRATVTGTATVVSDQGTQTGLSFTLILDDTEPPTGPDNDRFTLIVDGDTLIDDLAVTAEQIRIAACTDDGGAA